ncbi:MAG: hypothetical protein FJ388_07295 [Verrucomicrobia bacterium]|nr:hypothetical protein [Verrucomicrobiota bacterium]
MWLCALCLLLATCAPSHAADPAGATKSSATKNPLAGCQQCHVDIEAKYVRSPHFKKQVACTDCHGPSKGHIADENNEVKPDKLFTRKTTDRLCAECHACSRPQPSPPANQPSSDSKLCTDCHGSHALARIAIPGKQPK